jgi:hypothetical protein
MATNNATTTTNATTLFENTTSMDKMQQKHNGLDIL